MTKLFAIRLKPNEDLKQSLNKFRGYQVMSLGDKSKQV